MNERWLPVIGYEGLYDVSDLGRVRSLPRATTAGRILSSGPHPNGYRDVKLSRNGAAKTRLVHQLVLEAFVGPMPDGCEGAHRNGDSADCALSNLGWLTSKENAADAIAHGTLRRGERHHNARLTDDQAREIRDTPRSTRIEVLAVQFGISASTVKNIQNGHSWRHLDGR